MGLRAWIGAFGVFLMVVTMIGVGAAVLFGRDAPAPTTATTPPPEFAAPQAQLPTPEAIAIAVNVSAQHCEPDGGCVYTYSIEPQYIGFHPLPEDPFTVGYQVTGGHEPQFGEFTVHNGQAMVAQDATVAGPSGAQLRAAVTEVTVPEP